VCLGGLASNRFLRSTARSISFGGATRSFTKPCETTAAIRAVEEVQDPAMNSLKADTEFANPVAQKVRFGPPQFVAHLAQALQPEVTLVLYFGRQRAEPLQERA